jgi:hypothetical protein
MAEYDVFLSHNSADRVAVEELARRLVKANIRPWLDKWNLIPGEPWQEAIEEALDDCQTVAVFLGPTGIGPWENEEMRSALEDRVRDKSRRVIPVLLPGAPDPQERPLPRFLRRLTWVDFRDGLDDADAFHWLVSGIKGEAPGPIVGPTQPAQSEVVLPAKQEDDVIARLEHFNLKDETDPAFGINDLTRDLLQIRRSLNQIGYMEVQRATSSTIFLAIPLTSVKPDAVVVVKTARALFQFDRWYDVNRLGPRYYAREIFPLSSARTRTVRREVVVEQAYDRAEENLLIGSLRINQFGEVAYATCFRTFGEFVEGPRIFRLGAIVNLFWSFLCLTWEFYESIGYAGSTRVCVAMVNTKDSLLGHFAKGWSEPYQPGYRGRFVGQSEDEVCRDPNLLICKDTDFTTFQPKVEPDVVYQVAEEIALAYNQPEARCFEPNTRKLMEFKLHN